MNTPPLLMFAALLFWGWRTNLMIPALLAGALLEASRFVPLRWDFSEKELKRIWDSCVLLLIGSLAYTYFSQNLSSPTFVSIQWLPLLFLPIMLAQAFGHLEKIPAGTFFLLMFKRPRAPHEGALPAINISFAYFGLCLLGAGATSQRSQWFFGGICALVAWALWPHRGRRFSAMTWIGLFMGVLALAYFSSAGLTRLQLLLEGRLSEWIAGLVRQDVNSGESSTAIGQIVKLKLSGRILFRLEADGTPPDLLRKASYDTFTNPVGRSVWVCLQRRFSELEPPTEEGVWKLIPNLAARQKVTISGYLTKGAGIIALPMGTVEISKLPVVVLRTNVLGTVQGLQGPGLVRYDARFGSGASLDGPAREVEDLQISDSETNALASVVASLELEGKPPAEAARQLVDFFQKNFAYTTTLTLPKVPKNKTADEASPMSQFLLNTRAGHCEYFATATALLLRKVGIPARYVTGFSVQESGGPHKFIVRERHAHAWVTYFDKATGTWNEVDTTPSGWGKMEANNASWWEPVSDFFSRMWYEFSAWRWLADRSMLQRYIFWLLVPLVGILTYRLLTAKRRGRAGAGKNADGSARRWPGTDSEFYRIEELLGQLGLAREPGETFSDWIARLKRITPCPVSSDPINAMLELHYRYRFDPAGISEPERTRLRDLVQAWLTEARAAAGSTR